MMVSCHWVKRDFEAADRPPRRRQPEGDGDMNVADFLLETLILQGERQYGLERVSQLEHALQCAALAGAEAARPALVVAALFHDIGHLLPARWRSIGPREADDHHEANGADLLERWFGPDVTEPVRLHVPAKRYLCAIDPDYHDGLSRASKRSLALQGGPLPADEAVRFAARPFAAEAIRLRRWDDRAMEPGRETPPAGEYHAVIEALLEVQRLGARVPA
jgi:phosphonate degradation associated HDIG domain protein